MGVPGKRSERKPLNGGAACQLRDLAGVTQQLTRRIEGPAGPTTTAAGDAARAPPPARPGDRDARDDWWPVCLWPKYSVFLGQAISGKLSLTD